MPGVNLTRLEAAERAALLRVTDYRITLDLDRGDEVFGSTTQVRFDATPGASTFIDAITRAVHSITLNGQPIDPSAADGFRIQLGSLKASNTLTVVADAEYTNTGEGLHRFVDPVDGEVYLYSQFEVADARRVFAVFEQPDLKARFQFTVTAPARWEIVSNSPTPEPVLLPGGEIAQWSFAPTARIPSYIAALIAGPFEVKRDSLISSDGRTIPLGVFCRSSLAEHLDADYIFEKTRQGFAYFEQRFEHPYPFEKYDQLFVPEFNAGAMENAGAVTFTEAFVFRSAVTDAARERRVATILHELAHMWFGNLVTMKWWDGLWLNESFAEWAATIACAEASEWGQSWTSFQAVEKTWAYRQDQLPSTHPVVATIDDLEDVYVNFDGITYAKGGSVLKQLVAWVGIDAFFAGVAQYFKHHCWGNTTLTDLLAALEEASGRSLSEWSAAWLETAGVNTLRPEIETDTEGRITSFAVVQTAPDSHPTLRPHRLGIGFYSVEDGALRRVHRVEIDVTDERTAVSQLVGLAHPGLVLLNDDDLAYAKIRLDPASLATAKSELSVIEDPLARALVWGSLWDATRDAELPAHEYVDLVLAHINEESESSSVRTILGQLTLAAQSYVTPAARLATLEKCGSALWQLAQSAKPSSDSQLQLLTAFAALASTPEHCRTVREILDGTLLLQGLVLDTDLRWELLESLVALGAAGADEIARALADDNTSAGQQAAARAGASIPSAEAKRTAADALLNDESLPNAILRHTARGLLRTHDTALLEPLVERYFAELVGLWQSRSPHTAQALAVGLYPAPLASQALADASISWLDNNAEAAPALRRIVVENLDAVERALRVQRFDAS